MGRGVGAELLVDAGLRGRAHGRTRASRDAMSVLVEKRAVSAHLAGQRARLLQQLAEQCGVPVSSHRASLCRNAHRAALPCLRDRRIPLRAIHERAAHGARARSARSTRPVRDARRAALACLLHQGISGRARDSGAVNAVAQVQCAACPGRPARASGSGRDTRGATLARLLHGLITRCACDRRALRGHPRARAA
jgi:hypothetical protein